MQKLEHSIGFLQKRHFISPKIVIIIHLVALLRRGLVAIAAT
jgi:hypothetical protein